MDNQMTWEEMLRAFLAANQQQAAPATYPGYTPPATYPVPALAADQPAYYKDWRDFLEQRNQYQQQAIESQRQFNATMVANLTRDQETARQFNADLAANLGRDTENKRRYEKDFGAAAQQRSWEQAYIPKRDAWSIAGASVLPNIRFLTR